VNAFGIRRHLQGRHTPQIPLIISSAQERLAFSLDHNHQSKTIDMHTPMRTQNAKGRNNSTLGLFEFC
jgi:hypothetical protein